MVPSATAVPYAVFQSPLRAECVRTFKISGTGRHIFLVREVLAALGKLDDTARIDRLENICNAYGCQGFIVKLGEASELCIFFKEFMKMVFRDRADPGSAAADWQDFAAGKQFLSLAAELVKAEDALAGVDSAGTGAHQVAGRGLRTERDKGSGGESDGGGGSKGRAPSAALRRVPSAPLAQRRPSAAGVQAAGVGPGADRAESEAVVAPVESVQRTEENSQSVVSGGEWSAAGRQERLTAADRYSNAVRPQARQDPAAANQRAAAQDTPALDRVAGSRAEGGVCSDRVARGTKQEASGPRQDVPGRGGGASGQEMGERTGFGRQESGGDKKEREIRGDGVVDRLRNTRSDTPEETRGDDGLERVDQPQQQLQPQLQPRQQQAEHIQQPQSQDIVNGGVAGGKFAGAGGGGAGPGAVATTPSSSRAVAPNVKSASSGSLRAARPTSAPIRRPSNPTPRAAAAAAAAAVAAVQPSLLKPVAESPKAAPNIAAVPAQAKRSRGATPGTAKQSGADGAVVSAIAFLLQNNRISEDNADRMRRASEGDRTVTELILNGDKVGGEGARALAKVLSADDCGVATLDLTRNNLDDMAVNALAKMLSSNSSLTKLVLRYNKIGLEGCKALANALKQNKTLREIYLGHNPIGDEGAGLLARAAKSHPRLSKVALDDAKINVGANPDLGSILT